MSALVWCDSVVLPCTVQTRWPCKHADRANTWETSRTQLPACCTHPTLNPKLEWVTQFKVCSAYILSVVGQTRVILSGHEVCSTSMQVGDESHFSASFPCTTVQDATSAVIHVGRHSSDHIWSSLITGVSHLIVIKWNRKVQSSGWPCKCYHNKYMWANEPSVDRSRESGNQRHQRTLQNSSLGQQITNGNLHAQHKLDVHRKLHQPGYTDTIIAGVLHLIIMINRELE